MQLTRHALPHRNHEGRREEHADLAELDLFGLVVVTRGTQDDQPHISVVALDLGPYMKGLCVLYRQLVQAEAVTDQGQLLGSRLEQSQPHEAALPAPGRSLLQRHRAFTLPAAVLVVSTINDHLGAPLSGSRGRHLLHSMAESRDCHEDRAWRRRNRPGGGCVRAVATSRMTRSDNSSSRFDFTQAGQPVFPDGHGAITIHRADVWTDPCSCVHRIVGMSTGDLRAPGPGPRPRQRQGEDPDGLVRHVARGDESAFEAVYDQLSRPVYGLIRKVLRDPAQSEEVTQEVLLEVWRTAYRFDPAKGSAMAWVMTIAHRRAIDRARSVNAQALRERKAGSVLAGSAEEVAEAVETRLDAERVRRCLDSLTELQRESIGLAYYGGYTYQQVAGVLDAALGTIKTRIRDGLIRLRDCMGVSW